MMKTPDVLSEIRHTRDELARECHYHVDRLMDLIGTYEAEEKARGIPFVSFAKAGAESPAPKSSSEASPRIR